MITVNYGGTQYCGRLIDLRAVEDVFHCPDGTDIYKNKAYDLTFMDANGAIIYLLIYDLSCVIFNGDL